MDSICWKTVSRKRPYLKQNFSSSLHASQRLKSKLSQKTSLTFINIDYKRNWVAFQKSSVRFFLRWHTHHEGPGMGEPAWKDVCSSFSKNRFLDRCDNTLYYGTSWLNHSQGCTITYCDLSKQNFVNASQTFSPAELLCLSSYFL